MVKKYLVLGILFLLPITIYMFFATGVNNFAKLPVLTSSVNELPQEEPVALKDKITVLGFFGDNIENNKAQAFNLAHKIYKKNFQFKDFQMVFIVSDNTKEQIDALKVELSQIADPVQWKFITLGQEETQSLFNSLQTNLQLDTNLSTPYVFIIDKDLNLRGRRDDDLNTPIYGFDASNYSEINNMMSDDIKVLLAEYRLALKKNNSRNIN